MKEEDKDHFHPPLKTFARSFAAPLKPEQFKSFQPTNSETIHLLNLAHRMASYVGEERAAQRLPLFDMEVPSMSSPARVANQGLPLGGIGCGSIGRSHTGDFNRIDLQPLTCQNGIIAANQFSLRAKTVRTGGSVPSAVVLSTFDPRTSSGGEKLGDLTQWNWGQLNAKECSYQALFPTAWYTYENPLPGFGLRLVCKQISPCCPHEYDDSGLPVAVFRWHIENTSNDVIDASLMFTFDNKSGITNTEYRSKCSGSVCGVTLQKKERIPNPPLRPEWLDSPQRIRYCTFREFLLFLCIFLISLLGGPFIINGMETTESILILTLLQSHHINVWWIWGITTLTFFMLSQIAFFYPCKLHVRWLDRHCCCKRCRSELMTYNRPATAFTISSCPILHGIETTVSTFFPTVGDTSTAAGTGGLWEKFVETGRATTTTTRGGGSGSGSGGSCRGSSESGGCGGGAAVAQSFTLQAGESCELRFCLSWASPIVHFGGGCTVTRRYARIVNPLDSETITQLETAVALSEKITSIAMDDQQWKVWEEKIVAWHQPVLQDKSLPTWYAPQLFNELYFLQAGGVVWCDRDDDDSDIMSKTQTTLLGNIGHWLYLEGQEYYMYNTADVHFYASAALAMNWPLIERSIQLDYAKSVLQEDLQLRGQLGEYRWGEPAIRKPYGIVPHDVGSPSGIPWEKLNAYNFQDVSRWKDLGTKFVLQVMRDYKSRSNTNNDEEKKKEEQESLLFVKACWPAVVAVMTKMKEFDCDNDGMIENEGFPDQTYDIWSAKGVSAYSGGLWLASLQAAEELAKIAMSDSAASATNDGGGNNDDDGHGDGDGDGESAYGKEYHDLFLRGQQVYQHQLWNNAMHCYDYDSSDSAHHDSIMADQLAGHQFSLACGFNGIVSSTHARQALKTVFQRNVLGFRNGTMGAMNGMRPNGEVDKSSMQSQEVWTGTTYFLAAAMIHVGLKEEGMQTASGISKWGWTENGYFFQTPEGWNELGHYRSLGYMRPLAIWNMQWALHNKMNM